MNIESVKEKLKESAIYHSDSNILGNESVAGYEKKFKWSWSATQLNTFVIVTDFGEKEIDENLITKHMNESFAYSKKNYNGWPRGLQSGLGVISILISKSITEEAKEFCQKLKSGKKWAAFSIPVVHDSSTKETFHFEKNPTWGGIYYPHFKKLINDLK